MKNELKEEFRDLDNQELVSEITQMFEREQLSREIEFVRCDFTKTIKNMSEVFNQFSFITFISCDFRKENNLFNNVDNAKIEILTINGCDLRDNFITQANFSKLVKLDLCDNRLSKPLFLKYLRMPNLAYLDLSKNMINFEKSELKEFCKMLKTEFFQLDHLLLAENNFPTTYDYFIVAAKALSPQIKSLDGMNIDESYLEDIERRNEIRDRDEREGIVSTNMDNSDGEDEIGGKLKFDSLTKKVEKCMRNPSNSISSLTDLKNKIDSLVKDNQKQAIFYEEDQILRYKIDKFLIQMTLLIESQKSTEELVIDALASMIKIEQGDCSTKCFKALSNLTKISKQLKLKVRKMIKNNVVSRFHIQNLKQIDYNGDQKMMKNLVDLIEENEMFELIDKEMIDCMNSWMIQLNEKDFKVDSYSNMLILSCLKLMRLIARFFDNSKLAYEVIKMDKRYLDNNQHGQTFAEYFVFNHLIDNFVIMKSRKHLGSESSNYFDWIITFVEAIGFFCNKETDESDETVELNTRIATDIYNNQRFMVGFVGEINDFITEISLKGEAVKNHPLRKKKSECFQTLLITLNILLKNASVIDHKGETDHLINISSPLFNEKIRSSQGLFYEIFELPFQSDADFITLSVKSSIYTFIADCLENKKLVAQKGKVKNHFLFVESIVKILNRCIPLLHIIDVISKELNPSLEKIANAISVCRILYYFSDFTPEIIEEEANPNQQEELYSSTPFDDEKKEDTPADIEKNIKKVCDGIMRELDHRDKNKKLFSCLRIEDDDLKIAVVRILNSVPVTQYEFKDIETLWGKVTDHKNVGTGRTELVLGTIYVVLAKIVNNKEKADMFVRFHGKECVSETIELLHKNMVRDVREDEDEQSEKDKLSACAVLFLKHLVRTQAYQTITEPGSLFENTLNILEFESKYNPIDALDCDLERAVSKDNTKHLVEYVKKLPPHSYPFFRIVSHLADILDGENSVDKYYLRRFSGKLNIDKVVFKSKESKEKTIKFELSRFIEDEEKIFLEAQMVNGIEEEDDKELGEEDMEKVYLQRDENFFVKINEAMGIMHEEKILRTVMNMILKTIHEKEGNRAIKSELHNEEFLTLRERFIRKSKNLFNIRSKKQGSGQKYLINQLKSKRGKDLNLGVKRKKQHKVEGIMRGMPPPKARSDLFKYTMVPLTPGHISERVNLQKEPKGKFLKVRKERMDVYERRIFTLNVCALLRLIYNMLNNAPNPENSHKILHFLSSRNNLTDLMYLCERAGWGEGYISSKFLKIISLNVRNSEDEIVKGGRNRLFEDDIAIYHLRFIALGKVIDFFQKKFNNENVAQFSDEEIHVLEEISVNCFQTMRKVKEIIIQEKSGLDYPSGKRKRFYDIYADKQKSPANELAKWVLNKYIPERFLKIFIESLVKIQKSSDGEYRYNHEFPDEFRKIMQTSRCISDFISLYISVFPKKRFNIIKYFLEAENKEGEKVRTQIIANIIENSYFATKIERMSDYMNTHAAGKGTFSEENEMINISTYGHMMSKNFSTATPVILIVTNYYLYVMVESLKEPSILCSKDSLSPEPPTCEYKFSLFHDQERDAYGSQMEFVEEDSQNIEEYWNGFTMVEMPDCSTIRLEAEGNDPLYFDLRTNDNLEYFKKAFEASFGYTVEDKVMNQEDIFGLETISLFSVVEITNSEEIDYKKIYSQRGKKILIVDSNGMEIVNQDFSYYEDTEAKSKNEANEVKEGKDRILFNMIYKPSPYGFIPYATLKSMIFENTELSRVQIFHQGSSRPVDLLFPCDYERERFKWSMTHSTIEARFDMKESSKEKLIAENPMIKI